MKHRTPYAKVPNLNAETSDVWPAELPKEDT